MLHQHGGESTVYVDVVGKEKHTVFQASHFSKPHNPQDGWLHSLKTSALQTPETSNVGTRNVLLLYKQVLNIKIAPRAAPSTIKAIFGRNEKSHVCFAILVIIDCNTCYACQHLPTPRTEAEQRRKCMHVALMAQIAWRCQTTDCKIKLICWASPSYTGILSYSGLKCLTLNTTTRLWFQVFNSELNCPTLNKLIQLRAQVSNSEFKHLFALKYPTLKKNVSNLSINTKYLVSNLKSTVQLWIKYPPQVINLITPNS